MSYTRPSLAAAEREASDRNVVAERNASPYRYCAQRYPDGTDNVAAWKWGVMEVQPGYHHSGAERTLGFVWKAAQ